MNAHSDVLIVGGGVIGLTTAWFLAHEGIRVTVVDREAMGRQASWAGAGIIPPASFDHASTPIDQLRAFSNQLYPALSEELRESTGIDNEYLCCGGIELPEFGDSTPLPTEEWHSPGIAFDLLDAISLPQRDPFLSGEIHHGVFLPGITQVRNPRHLQALQGGCVHRRVTLLPYCPVSQLIMQGNRVTGVEGPQGRLLAGEVIITSGAWSDQLLQSVGWQPGVVPVRGQIVLLQPIHSESPLVRMQGKRYLVTRKDGKLLVGSTEEHVGFDPRPTAQGVHGLIAFAQKLVPSLKEATLLSCWAGLRPGSPDGLPFLGPVPGVEGLTVACGHFRAGLQLSPATGRLMADYLLKRPLSISLEPFRIDRPQMKSP